MFWLSNFTYNYHTIINWRSTIIQILLLTYPNNYYS